MKKFFSMMVAVAAMFTFAACGGDDTTDPAPQPNPGTPTKLEKPVVTITDTKEDGFTVTWEPVANATEYLVYLNSSNQPKTSGTSYTFTELNAGDYKPRVKALGTGNYTDSDYSDAVTVTITGATSVNWFSQTLELAENTEANAAKGVNSSNTVVFTWKGTDVKSIYYYFLYEEEFGLSDATIKNNLKGLGEKEAEFLAAVNSAEGCTLSFGGLPANSQFKLCALATNNAGKEFFAKSEAITTGDLILTTAAAAFAGTWNVTTPQTVDFSGEEIVIADEEKTFTALIEPFMNYSQYLNVAGFSEAGEGYPFFAYTAYLEDGGYAMYVFNGDAVQQMDESNYLAWLAYCDINIPSTGQSGVSFVAGEYPAMLFYYYGDTNVETEVYAGELQNGGTFTVRGIDLFAMDAEGYYNGMVTYVGEDNQEYTPLKFKYGTPQFTNKTSNYTPSAKALASQKINARTAAVVAPVSCVVAM